ncbi:hypothetical protein PAPYR_6752 [Paratrimastix pyriformis]|uniref:Uncharacterized protein n=1 Tax=Paratrimastix pyriformis TaxID=342808 RepID=A0ABQ8UH29_9EUKA|nr:hypothetical protein PAPYR_6752 [Paratrimastix pyriformis]
MSPLQTPQSPNHCVDLFHCDRLADNIQPAPDSISVRHSSTVPCVYRSWSLTASSTNPAVISAQLFPFLITLCRYLRNIFQNTSLSIVFPRKAISPSSCCTAIIARNACTSSASSWTFCASFILAISSSSFNHLSSASFSAACSFLNLFSRATLICGHTKIMYALKALVEHATSGVVPRVMTSVASAAFAYCVPIVPASLCQIDGIVLSQKKLSATIVRDYHLVPHPKPFKLCNVN